MLCTLGHVPVYSPSISPSILPYEQLTHVPRGGVTRFDKTRPTKQVRLVSTRQVRRKGKSRQEVTCSRVKKRPEGRTMPRERRESNGMSPKLVSMARQKDSFAFGFLVSGFGCWLQGVGFIFRSRKVDVSLPGKGNSNSHGARPVYQNHVDDEVASDHCILSRKRKVPPWRGP